MNDVAISHSNFERNENDLYRTEPWVTRALLDQYPVHEGKLWEPACGHGDMADVLFGGLGGRGGVATDIAVEETGYGDFEFDFIKDDRHQRVCEEYDICSIITNPPFGKEAVAFARKIVDLVSGGRVHMGALLLRTEFSSASGRADLFADCNVFDCEIRLTKRPRWDDWWNGNPPHASPRHNYSWFVWNVAADQGTSPDGSRLLHREPTIRWAGP